MNSSCFVLEKFCQLIQSVDRLAAMSQVSTLSANYLGTPEVRCEQAVVRCGFHAFLFVDCWKIERSHFGLPKCDPASQQLANSLLKVVEVRPGPKIVDQVRVAPLVRSSAAIEIVASDSVTPED